ncbi:hypothetical protein SAMN05421810_103744 [Amycolatopsis arida]|uniref:Uncharacterized protein n=1 Tax=Amycolatopsis arida TaxID=587909 RepID=A0A1I5U029_9PSEU|nr:hypothetical protein [Amycolatopsis arida]TDX95881.1 hypothetical protein CLV69_10313 [Amycolatopsis arida]SFP88662.1 hypothetical protein SAMN05421810_103744 [Amycolatopsis arida]
MTQQPRSDRPGPLRVAVGYAAILGTLPYLTLKLAWLTGHPLGLADPDLVDGPMMYAANAFTGGMDLVAILLALTFTHDRRGRAPAWPLVFPIWVGTGFLAPIALAGPLIGVDFALPTEETTGPALEPWVTPLVYASFAWQGVTLLTAFALYARVRWAALFSTRLGAVPLGGTGAVAAVLGVVAAVTHLAWALGVPVGVDVPRGLGQHAVNAVDGLLALAAVAGLLAAARGRTGSRWALAAGWTGEAAMFAWGFWSLVTTTAMAEVFRGPTAAHLVVQGARCLGGILLGVAVLRVVSRRAGTAAGPVGAVVRPAA